jgi:hypothetical protein
MAFTGNFTCDVFKTGLLTGAFNFSSGSFYMALYTNNATLNASTTAYTATGEASGGNYSAGGQLLTGAAVAISSNIAYITFNNPSWTGAITARGALIYKSGANGAVCVLDFGSNKVSTSTGTFVVQFPVAASTSAIIRLV